MLYLALAGQVLASNGGMQMNKQEMPLKAIAQSLGVTKTKLHYYRNLGLIKPSNNFKDSKIHLYDLTEIKAALEKIQKLQTKGMTLIEIAQDFSAK